MEIKNVAELKEGKTYLIEIGDEKHQPRLRDKEDILNEVRKLPKINFLLLPYFWKLRGVEEIIEKKLVEDFICAKRRELSKLDSSQFIQGELKMIDNFEKVLWLKK